MDSFVLDLCILYDMASGHVDSAIVHDITTETKGI